MKQPQQKSSQASVYRVGGVGWPTLRLMILTFEALFILNMFLFNSTPESDSASNRKAATTASLLQQYEGTLLSQCDEEAFDLRNERHRGHQSSLEPICSKFPAGATAASLWKQHATKVLEASIHPKDTSSHHAPWTRDLQNLLRPYLLERGLRTQPQHTAVKRVMRILQNKLENPDTAPPLEVAVVGGSVTQGVGCEKLPKGVQTERLAKDEKPPVIQGMECAWPFRLQQILDKLGNPGLIRIHNLAAGGTNSDMAVPVLDYWLFPEKSPLLERGPDVIINAYAANDNLPPAKDYVKDEVTGSTNTTGDYFFYETIAIQRTQQFLRTSIQSRPCREEPLVIYVDEYLGNQHNILLGELMRFEAVDILTDWYSSHAAAVSSAQVVRRLVLADTDENLFSAVWQRNGKDRVDVHFGMLGHMLIAWTAAYSILTMALHFCEEELSRAGDDDEEDTRWHDIVAVATNSSRELTSYSSKPASLFVDSQALQLVEQAVPPSLDFKLQVDNIAKQWQKEADARHSALQQFCGKDTVDTATAQAPPCSFAFVAAPMGTASVVHQLNRYLKPFIVTNDGWASINDIQSGGWRNKLGFVATKAGASILLRVPKTPNKVSRLTLHSLKSYGEKWEGSKARFTLKWNHESSGRSHETIFEVEGFHNQTTSITYPYVLDLTPEESADVGSNLELQIDLIGGTTFKINALMICSR